MHEYDIVLKNLLGDLTNSLLEQLTGEKMVRWLQVELPTVQNPRMDLLGETASGELIHIELQSTNDWRMALRMAEYLMRAFRLHGRFPRQIVLYVGESALSMPTTLKGPKFSFEYELIDIRQLDAESLLASPRLSDNVLSILCGLNDRREGVRRVLLRIAESSGEERGLALQQLSILAGLRQLEDDLREEIKQMPVLNDIMDNRIIGPAVQQGMQQGMQQIVRQLIEKRFGPLSVSMESQFKQLGSADLEALALKVVDASRMEDLFTI